MNEPKKLRAVIRDLQRMARSMLVVIGVLLLIILWLALLLHARAAEQPPKTATEAPVIPMGTTEYADAAQPEAPAYIYLSDCPLAYGYQEVMQDACRAYDVPYALALGVAEAESSFDKDADSGVAYGLMQIHPINYARLQGLGIDPETYEGNIEAGVFLLSELLKEYPTTHKALMAYNCGETGAAALWADGYVTSDYSRKVTEYATKWQRQIDAETQTA